jgi:hypothetical protein
VSETKSRANPFYVILVLVGVVFAITATAYGVMAVKQLHASQTPWAQQAKDAGFVLFMDRHGPKLMLIELGVLALATFAAIGTDSIWSGSEPPDNVEKKS